MGDDVAYVDNGTPVTCQEHYDWMKSKGDVPCEAKFDFSKNEGIIETCCKMPTGKHPFFSFVRHPSVLLEESCNFFCHKKNISKRGG